jgi:hypothetical protein
MVKKRIYLFEGLVLWAALFLLLPVLPGQTVSGRITGTITDPSGGGVPGAEITLTNLATGVTRTTTSGSSGAYILESVLPGTYSLQVRKAGFKKYVVSDIILRVNQSRTVDVQLTLGSTTQSVEVKAHPLALDTTTATVGQVIEHQEMVQLPLNGRNFTQLTLLTPGASPVQTGQQSAFTVTGGISPAVNGMRAQMNDFTLDGVDNNMRFTNTYAQAPPPDALEEFNVESHQSAAEASFAAGATVNLVTRPGTNEFHGSVWEFLRNDALDANGFFNNFFGASKLPRKQNQYGFFAGGPVVIPGLYDGRKSRTYFASYFEGFKVRISSVTSANVPDAAMREGDFSETLGPAVGTDCLGRTLFQGEIYNPLTTVANSSCPQGYVRDPFPNNIIPPGDINPIAATYFKFLYPMPNRSTFPNFVLPQRTTQNNWQWGTRIDHSFSEKDTIFGRISQYNAAVLNPGALPIIPLQQVNSGVNIAGHETHIFSPTFLGNFLFGYNRATIPYRNLTPGPAFAAAVPSDLGLNTSIGFMPAGQSFIGSNITGAGFFDYELANPDASYQGNADFKKISGKHDLGFGFRYMYFRHFTPLQGQASLAYSPFTTDLPGDNLTGNSVASFMLGYPTTSQQNIFPKLGLHTSIYIAYWGDIWKLTPKLTLDLGLQYVYDSPPVADGNRISDFDFGKALTQPNATDFAFAFLWATQNPITGAPPNAPRPSLISPDRNNFAPRIGFAYSLTPNTVVRGGFGLYYDYNTNINQNSIRVLEPNYPYSAGRTVSSQNLLTLGPENPPISLNNPFLGPSAAVPSPNWSLDLNKRDPYAMEWNFGIEKLLSSNMKLTVAYLGSGSRKLPTSTEENIARVGTGPIATRRPLHNTGSFIYNQNLGTANYDALQVKLEKSFSHGLTFLESYTWSKSMDINSDANAVPIEYTYDRALSYGPSDYNVPQMSVTSFVYQLPVGRGRKFASGASGVLDQLIGGWQTSGIVTLRSGLPFTVYSGTDSANIGSRIAGEYAQIVAPAVPSGFTQTRAAWIDPASFAIPTFGTLGNSSRNAFQGPSYADVDFAMMKNFKLTEKTQLQFRSEFFNFFNTTNFGNPVSTVTTGPLFGQILSAYAAREIQFALKLTW